MTPPYSPALSFFRCYESQIAPLGSYLRTKIRLNLGMTMTMMIMVMVTVKMNHVDGDDGGQGDHGDHGCCNC